MNTFYPKTSVAAKELQDSLKCLACNTSPLEPYFADACDHLLCKFCIAKTNSNKCPICEASFFQNESQLNNVIKEALDHVNKLVQLTEDSNEMNLNAINLNDELSATSATTTALFKEPLAPTSSLHTAHATKSNTKPKDGTQVKNTTRNKTLKALNQEAISSKMIDQSQTGTQKSRAVSLKRKYVKNDKGEGPLHIAVINGDLQMVNEFLKGSTPEAFAEEVNRRDLAGWTPLHEACNQANLEIVKLLCSHSANLNALGYHDNTPLHEAALQENFECCKYLLEVGANKCIRNQFGVLASDFVRKLPEFVELFNSAEFDQLNVNQHGFSNGHHDNENKSVFNVTQSNKKNNLETKMLLFGTGMNDQSKSN
jgi:hypothetical protein